MLEYTLIVSNIGTVFTGKADAHTMSAKEMDHSANVSNCLNVELVGLEAKA
jgi:hypothetical protein